METHIEGCIHIIQAEDFFAKLNLDQYLTYRSVYTDLSHFKCSENEIYKPDMHGCVAKNITGQLLLQQKGTTSNCYCTQYVQSNTNMTAKTCGIGSLVFALFSR